MTEQLKMFAGMKANDQFLSDMWKADKDEVIELIYGSTKAAIAMGIYYGWLVARYGPHQWRNNI